MGHYYESKDRASTMLELICGRHARPVPMQWPTGTARADIITAARDYIGDRDTLQVRVLDLTETPGVWRMSMTITKTITERLH